MRSEFLPFCVPDITESDIDAVAGVMRSGWITTGRHGEAFEKALCEISGAEGCVAVASATAGMHLVLKALELGPGDEVITPSMTWVSTVNLIQLSGATPVFVDVERDSLMTTAELIREKITDKTRLIIPVHFAGASLDLDPIYALAEERGIPVVEDAAHAIGTEYKGRPVGARGTAIFSFHPIKNVTTGEGGAVVSDDAALLARVKRLRFHGLGVDAYDRRMQGRSPQAEVLEPGYKYNLTDMASALGCNQLKRLEQNNSKRRTLVAHYRELLAAIPGISPLETGEYCSRDAAHLFIVRVDPEVCRLDRDAFMAALKERNIGSGLHFKAVHLQSFYRKHYPEQSALPKTEWNSARICSLPLFPGMNDSDVEDVVAAISDILAPSGNSVSLS